VDTLSLLPWQLVVVLVASFEAPEHTARILESIGSDDQGVGRGLHTLDRFPSPGLTDTLTIALRNDMCIAGFHFFLPPRQNILQPM
jgi:hypothetical protein